MTTDEHGPYEQHPYHGVSIRDAAMMLGVPEQTIRTWLKRGKIERTPDGQINPFTLREWWDIKRHKGRGKRNPANQAKHNPYAHPESPASQAAS